MSIKKLLIVDDEVEHLETMIDVFEETESDYRILQALNGNKAYEIAEKEIPDLIITDWDMPGMSGIELIKRIKSNKTLVDIPIIMCTGVMTRSKNLEIALAVGAADYIRKPIDKIELIARTNANLHLAESHSKIKKLNEFKDQLFSIIGHDLKSPVGRIKVLLELILDKRIDFTNEELFNQLHLLAKQSSAAYTILENLFVWAGSQMNHIIFDPSRQPVKPLIESNINLLENIASEKNITIQTEISDEIIAFIDSQLISITVRNLIANAIKFTPENGKIAIKVQQNDTDLIVKVEDTGVGIPDENLEKIFDKLRFETTYGTNGEKGSGLGLKLCKNFVEMHSGKIWAESKPSKGSTFVFTLPLVN